MVRETWFILNAKPRDMTSILSGQREVREGFFEIKSGKMRRERLFLEDHSFGGAANIQDKLADSAR